MRPMVATAFSQVARLGRSEAVAEHRMLVAERIRYLEPVDQPLVLIGQVDRSGGTLLLRLFDGHRQCHVVPYELQSIFRGMATDLRSADSAWKALASAKQFRRRRPLLMLPAVQRAIFETCRAELDEPTRRETMNCYFTAFFNGWLDNASLRAGSKRWVIGFEPRPGKRFAAYKRIYPDGRVISVLRDPWTWYSSARGRKPEWADLGVAVEIWREHALAALRWKSEDPAGVALVSFRDLLGRPEATMRTLAAWLGIDFEPTLLRPSFNGSPSRARSSFDDVGDRISTRPLGRAEDLSRDEIAAIDEQVGLLYEQALQETVDVSPASPLRNLAS